MLFCIAFSHLLPQTAGSAGDGYDFSCVIKHSFFLLFRKNIKKIYKTNYSYKPKKCQLNSLRILSHDQNITSAF